ncbi:Putative ABC transporter arginine-binding protein 2 precursor [Kingella potus]|uniref:ABC transporter arginine-binding protein 2 n=1 Tax=Kingella potus TaxID=265175 RepID=A0A377R1P5_9NEIS|nr:basic amino acid ABC transporter substrate-binding protein [Kingella potus]STR01009.1 Putative ABC transporter arginine-binding protein 2 precursor [Kingella potus]
MNIKQWIATAAAATLLAACGGQGQSENTAAPAASAAPQADKVYRVAANAEFAPFEFLDTNNNMQGFDVDLVNAMAAAGGFKVEFKHQPWDSLFAALGNGDVDILASAVTITDDRKQSMDFSDPYYKITQVILVPQGKDIKSADDLKNANKIGVVTGTTGDFAAGKLLGADNGKIARFENITLVTKELENGGLDAVISDSAVVANYVKNNGSKGFSMVSVPDFPEENYGFAVRKGNTETQAMLNDALKKVRESGEYDKIADKYFAKSE